MLVLGSLIPPAALHFLHDHGVLALFLLVLLQDVGVPTGVPGTVLVLFAGFLVSIGAVALHEAALFIALGAFIGATGMFHLARVGGRPLVLGVGRYIGLTEARLDATARTLGRWGPPMLLVTRIAPGTRVYMTLFAGVSGWTYRRFALWTGFFVLLWSYTFVGIGAALGSRWVVIAHYIMRFGVVCLVLVVLLAAAAIIYNIGMNRRLVVSPEVHKLPASVRVRSAPLGRKQSASLLPPPSHPTLDREKSPKE